MLLVILLSLSLSMDAFSLSLCFGTLNLSYKKIFIFSLIVGIFHFMMPLLGMNLGDIMLKYILIDPKYITSLIFLLLGIFMIFNKEEDSNTNLSSILSMILFALAVSIDSFAIGIGLNSIYDNHIISALTFSLFSFTFTLIGLLIGKYISNKIGNVSKIVGGLILIALSIQNLTK